MWWMEMLRPGAQEAARDDLIRLVVGMQWREAMLHHTAPDGVSVGECRTRPWSDLRPAVDIVDEWLGVR